MCFASNDLWLLNVDAECENGMENLVHTNIKMCILKIYYNRNFA